MQVVLQKTHSNGLIVLDNGAYKKMPQTCVANIVDQNAGGMGMKNLWWSWMEATATHMAEADPPVMMGVVKPDGTTSCRRKINKDDCHEIFTSKHMGTDENGKRLSWKLKSPAEDERIATKEQRLYAMEQHQVWCTERGIKLLNPEDSEFRQLQMEQER